MASHRLPDDERPRRAVPAWVTAPPEAPSAVLEAHPTPVASAPAPESAGPGAAFPAPASAPVPGTAFPTPASAPVPALAEHDVVVPDHPPREDLLPPAPTSPAVHTVPFDHRSVSAADAESPLLGPAPVSPIDAVAFGVPTAPVLPVVPVTGQPRFSVPGLEHVVVVGAEPEPSGPIGYRTPARFAHQQRPLVTPAPHPVADRSFDAVITPSAPAPTFPSGTAAAGPAAAAAGGAAADATTTLTEAPAQATLSPEAEPSLQARPSRRSRRSRSATAAAQNAVPASDDGADRAPARPLVGVTPAAVLGGVAGLMTLGVAAWWFTSPATVHGIGLVLGVLAVLLSVTVLRNPAVTWQRPVALLGAVLGGVGALVLLWAVASALLSPAGVALPDLTGTGTVPTLAP